MLKYYEQLLEMGCFSRTDIERLAGSKDAANSLIYSYKRRGLIDRIRRDLFVAISLETRQPVLNRYAIASHVAEDSYITHHSAFEYYGYANQVYYEVYVTSKTRFRDFEYDDIAYLHLSPSIDAGVIERRGGIKITNIERTVLDSINDFEKIGGLEELLRCIDMIPNLDPFKLIEYLMTYDKGILYKKTGYILGHFKESLKLPEGFFVTCRKAITKSKKYLYNGLQHEPHTLDTDWLLYVPTNLKALMRKGSMVDD